MRAADTNRRRSNFPLSLCIGLLASLVAASRAPAQDRERGDEIVANLAGGRVIIHVARDKIVFAAINQPVEPDSIPPRVLSIDHSHIGILLGASEWHRTSDPKPVRLDKDFPHVPGKNPNYAADPEEVAPDLDVIGVAFLERLRPLMNIGGGLKQTQVTADDPGEDPIKTLHDLSGDPDGIEILSILLDIMSTGFAHVGQGTPDEMYVWPYFAEKDIKTLTTPEKVDLMRIVTAGDYADMLEFGGYNFYRVGITPDGKWKFFTSGE